MIMIMINLTLLLNWCLVLSLSGLVQILGAEDGPEGCLGQQLGAVVGVLHVGHTHRGVADPVVDHRVHRHRHAVLGQHLNTLSQLSCLYYLFDLTSWGGTPRVIVLRSTFW